MQVGSLEVSVDNAVHPVVRASGELDQDSCGAFESILNTAFEKPYDRVDLILHDLHLVDSSGLRVLVNAALHGQRIGRRINIASMSPHLDRMLDISGFRHLFTISGIEPEPREAPKAPIGVVEPCLFAVQRDSGACRSVRDQVHEFARQMGFDQMALEDIKLAVGEAVSNAVRHGAECGKTIEVHCEQKAERLVVKLRYHSAEFDPQAVPTPTYTTAAEGGMGIYFMRLVMDDVRYEFAEGRTELTLEKRLV